MRKEFGRVALMVGSGDIARLKAAQSSNSKHLKFKSCICETCNSARTQDADNEFDAFSSLVAESPPGSAGKFSWPNEDYPVGGVSYLNVFRYFSKLLCCHLAEDCIPIPKRLSGFAIGKIDSNSLFLDIQSDWSYTELWGLAGLQNYAAHGGLVVYGNELTEEPTGFHSSLTIGPTQYTFWLNLAPVEQQELRVFYPEAYNFLQSIVRASIAAPLSDVDRRELGLR